MAFSDLGRLLDAIARNESGCGTESFAISDSRQGRGEFPGGNLAPEVRALSRLMDHTLLRSADYQETVLILENDDFVALFSDGLIEAADSSHEEFGARRICCATMPIGPWVKLSKPFLPKLLALKGAAPSATTGSFC